MTKHAESATEEETGRRLTDEEIRDADQQASLLRDALEASGSGWVEARAESGYATTVDGCFDLAETSRRFVAAMLAARLLMGVPTDKMSDNNGR
jgi:hypothetical protein